MGAYKKRWSSWDQGRVNSYVFFSITQVYFFNDDLWVITMININLKNQRLHSGIERPENMLINSWKDET